MRDKDQRIKINGREQIGNSVELSLRIKKKVKKQQRVTIEERGNEKW